MLSERFWQGWIVRHLLTSNTEKTLNSSLGDLSKITSQQHVIQGI